jgi:hypothetical protein
LKSKSYTVFKFIVRVNPGDQMAKKPKSSKQAKKERKEKKAKKALRKG